MAALREETQNQSLVVVREDGELMGDGDTDASERVSQLEASLAATEKQLQAKTKECAAKARKLAKMEKEHTSTGGHATSERVAELEASLAETEKELTEKTKECSSKDKKLAKMEKEWSKMVDAAREGRKHSKSAAEAEALRAELVEAKRSLAVAMQVVVTEPPRHTRRVEPSSSSTDTDTSASAAPPKGLDNCSAVFGARGF